MTSLVVLRHSTASTPLCLRSTAAPRIAVRIRQRNYHATSSAASAAVRRRPPTTTTATTAATVASACREGGSKANTVRRTKVTTASTTTASQQQQPTRPFLQQASKRSLITKRIVLPSPAFRPLSTLASADFLSCAYTRSVIYNNGNNNNDDGSSSTQSQTVMLASSPVAAMIDERTFLQRAVQWLREFCKNCWDTVLLTIRGSEVALRLSPLIVLTPASVLFEDFLRGTSTNFISDLTWSYFIYQIRELGPAFVKLAQWVATRRDIFPPQVCDRLEQLHDRGYPHAWKYTHQQLVDAFGEDYEARGLHIDPDDIIGCGSAAQVYSGMLLHQVLQENGTSVFVERPVAVKVLHPHLEEMVERDMTCLDTLAKLLHTLPIEKVRMLNLPKAAATFGAILRNQCDLRVEGANLRKFHDNFDRPEDPAKNAVVNFPQPVEEWTSPNILVEDLVHDAVPIAVYLHDDTPEGIQARKELAVPLLKAFLKMVFLDNFTHCDLHPGNVMIQTKLVRTKSGKDRLAGMMRGFWGDLGRTTAAAEPADEDGYYESEHKDDEDDGHDPFEDGEYEVKRTIVFLDAGITTTLDANHQRNLKDLFKAVILNDGFTAGQLLVERAPSVARATQMDGGVERFSRGIEELVSEFHDNRKSGGLTLGAVRIGSLLSRVLDLCRVYGVEVDPAMANIVISTLVLEGLGRSLEPNMNLMDFAIPFVLGRGRM